MDQSGSDTQVGYDRVAEQYATEFCDELKRKPFDCERLDAFAGSVRGQGLVYDVGCGPGHVARYLKDRGLDMCGLDLSAEMVKVASRLNPDIPFEQGDMSALKMADDSLAGAVLFYSIIHIEREAVTGVLQEIKRVLHPSGQLLLGFHGGSEIVHRDEWYGQPVSIDFRLFQGEEMAGYLKAAGFENVTTMQRDPYKFEYPTRRFYVLASKACAAL